MIADGGRSAEAARSRRLAGRRWSRRSPHFPIDPFTATSGSGTVRRYATNWLD